MAYDWRPGDEKDDVRVANFIAALFGSVTVLIIAFFTLVLIEWMKTV